jgi:Na+/H+-translocating membrane pyrophosphatase
LSSEFFTSHDYYSVQEVATSCRTGSATDIIYGLALGYSSTILTVGILVVVIYISYICAGMYGISLASCAMISTITTVLSIVSFNPIVDNAAGLSTFCKIVSAQEHTDNLHAAAKVSMGNGRCYEIGASSLIALSLFGAYVTKYKVPDVDILHPIQFSGLVIGAMLPYTFTSLILNSVSRAAIGVEEEIKKQKAKKETIIENVIRRCTNDSMKGMIYPALIVVLIPFAVGMLFGPASICGLLAGTIVSGVQIGISFINSGVAWDNAKKYIEGKNTILSYIQNRKQTCRRCQGSIRTIG